MRITESGILVRGQAGTARAVYTYPAAARLTNGDLLLSCRSGSTKDSEDETVELRRSRDAGRSWSEPWRPFGITADGKRGSLKVCYITELPGKRLIAASLWIDRQTYPGKPLFDPETEGCLPMAVLVADSVDLGATWSPWRVVPMPADVGPPSLTNPILRLPDGTLILSVETNKTYFDRSKWFQRVVYLQSHDAGRTWSAPWTVSQDPTGRIFWWDQRAGVAPDGRIVTFSWTYDSETKTYVNIHRRLSSDGGKSWTKPQDIGITDQAGPPAMLADGRVVLAWVDRFKDHSIRVRLAGAADAPFPAGTEVVPYKLGASTAGQPTGTTGDLLVEMGLWTFGLPYAVQLSPAEVLVLYYAGTKDQMDVHYARLSIPAP